MEEQKNTEEKKSSARRIIFPVILGIVVIVIGIYIFNKVTYNMKHEETDDAQVDATIYPILPRVTGYVDSVNFSDNDNVRNGELLVKIDDRDLIIKVAQAQAALQNAQASVSVAQSGVANAGAAVATAQANVDLAKVKVWKATQDFTRAQNLLKSGTYTQEQYDQAKSDFDGANSSLTVAQKQLDAASVALGASQQQVTVAQSIVKQKQSDLDYSKLQLSYAHIYSPASGIASKKSVQVGQYVQAGQPIFNIVDDSDIYVTANFKETQLDDMKVGQVVEVDVDAFSSTPLHGKLQSFSSATGARFSLLPPDNATGNFVKVVQRIPIKIVFDANQPLVKQLRPGMSVSVSVTTK